MNLAPAAPHHTLPLPFFTSPHLPPPSLCRPPSPAALPAAGDVDNALISSFLDMDVRIRTKEGQRELARFTENSGASDNEARAPVLTVSFHAFGWVDAAPQNLGLVLDEMRGAFSCVFLGLDPHVGSSATSAAAGPLAPRSALSSSALTSVRRFTSLHRTRSTLRSNTPSATRAARVWSPW